MPEEFVQDIIASAATEVNSAKSSTETSVDKVVESGDKAPVQEKSTNNDSSQESKSPTIEEIATQLGWRADHEGEDAVDAVTYILRSKDIQKSMSKHNKDLKENLNVVQASVNALKEHNERVYQAEVKKLQAEIATLKKERKAAIELADVDKVESLDAQIEEIQKDINAPKMHDTSNSDAATNPVYDAWIVDNEWYLNDPTMAQYADTVAQNYIGAPLERIYSIVRQKVQEVFPEKFEGKSSVQSQAAKTQVVKDKPIGPISPVDKGTNIKSSSNVFSKADLTPDQINIMNQFVRSGIMTEEAYINDIAKMQE